MEKLAGKIIMIIGATGGIGGVLSRAFHDEGAHVILSARTESKLKLLADSLGNTRSTITAFDASNASEVERALDITFSSFGSLDAVIIASGTWKTATLEISTEDFSELLDDHFLQHLKSSAVVAFAAAKKFSTQGYGHIINISSHAGSNYSLPGNLTYGPLKEASSGFMARLGFDKGLHENVQITDIRPAIVNTKDARESFLDTKEKQALAVQPEDIAHWIASNLNHPNAPGVIDFKSDLVI